MSIQVNDFRLEPGKNDGEYIKLLESSRDEWERIAKKAISKLKTLSKTQNTSLEEVAAEHGLTVDGVSFALNQYETIICEITHGMMSKLSYHAKDILQVAQERWCDTCELKEAQKPRLLTLDEIHDSMVVYLEAGKKFLKIVDDDGVVLAIGGSERAGAKCFITVWDVGIAAMNDDYNVTWRAWSERPTVEQRRATPWDGES